MTLSSVIETLVTELDARGDYKVVILSPPATDDPSEEDVCLGLPVLGVTVDEEVEKIRLRTRSYEEGEGTHASNLDLRGLHMSLVSLSPEYDSFCVEAPSAVEVGEEVVIGDDASLAGLSAIDQEKLFAFLVGDSRDWQGI